MFNIFKKYVIVNMLLILIKREICMRYKGFTLAEVLITLMIIGVVAALTIPSVISNYQQQEFKTGLKKAVSVLNAAIQANIAIEGETPYENRDLFSYLQRHMSILKKNKIGHCYSSGTGSAIELNDDLGSCYQMQGAEWQGNNVFYTTDGMRFEISEEYNRNNAKHFYLHETGIDASQGKKLLLKETNYTYSDIKNSGACGSYGLASNPNNTLNTPCIIMVDVNGDKKPNPPEIFSSGKSALNSFGNEYVYVTANQSFDYSYPSPTDKKLSDIFTIMITDEKAIPFGVVAQRAMYSK